MYGCDSYIVCVYNDTNSCAGCEANYTNISAITLPKENFELQFCSERIRLESVITIANSHSVLIRGMPTVLSCSKQLDTGVFIHNVSKLALQNIELIFCGSVFDLLETESVGKRFRSSMYITGCADIIIEGLAVVSGKGSGVVMFDNGGRVEINDCRFEKNSNELDSNIQHGVSGLHIVLSYCSPRILSDPTDKCLDMQGRDISYSSYLIKNCNFSDNTNRHNDTKLFPEDTELLAEGFSRGGGLSVVLDRNSTANMLHIIGCTFTRNSALWGGGLYVAIIGNLVDNSVEVEQCIFLNNHCTSQVVE